MPPSLKTPAFIVPTPDPTDQILFSPDGSEFARVTAFHFIERRKTADGSPLSDPVPFGVRITSMLYLPDNSILVGLCTGLVYRLHPDNSTTLAFWGHRESVRLLKAEDGEVHSIDSYIKGLFYIWELDSAEVKDSRQIVTSTHDHGGRLDFCQQQNLFCHCSRLECGLSNDLLNYRPRISRIQRGDDEPKIIKIAPPNVQRSFKSQLGRNGKLVVAGYDNGKIRLFPFLSKRGQSNAEIILPKRHKAPITFLDFITPHHMVSACKTATIRIWDFSELDIENPIVHRPIKLNHPILCGAVSPSRKILILASDLNLSFYSL